MQVGDVCCKNVVTVDPKMSIHEAAKRMRDHNVGSLVVLDEKSKPAGIVTDRDVVTRVVAAARTPDTTQVADVMGQRVVSVRESADLEMALECMTFGLRRVPVVDEEGRLTGILSLDDVLLRHCDQFNRVRRILQKEMPEPQRSGRSWQAT